jgi:hypothetical protein
MVGGIVVIPAVMPVAKAVGSAWQDAITNLLKVLE